jgi:hypothetical protein
MDLQSVPLSELLGVEGGFNWGAAADVAYNTTVATGSPVAGLVAGAVAGLLS